MNTLTEENDMEPSDVNGNLAAYKKLTDTDSTGDDHEPDMAPGPNPNPPMNGPAKVVGGMPMTSQSLSALGAGQPYPMK